MTSAFWRLLVAAMADPATGVREVRARPTPVRTLLGMVLVIVAVGAATLPRQLAVLARALAPSGDPSRDAHHRALAAGLTRVVLFDRLVPPPTVLVAGFFVLVLAEPVLALARDRRQEVRAALLLGLTPLVAQRLGELAVTYLIATPGRPSPGLAVSLPQQFLTGPAVFWLTDEAPAWIQAFSARVNLVTLWSVGVWAVALRELDGRRLSPWHVALPVACLGGGALVTWTLESPVLSMILGGP